MAQTEQQNEEQTPTGKPWLKSKTNWFGILMSLAGVLAVLVPEETQALVEQMPAEYQGGVLLCAGLITLYLRYVTTVPIE